MYETQGRYGRDDQAWNEAERMAEQTTRERVRSERIAQQLGRESLCQWSKAMTGFLALPTAVALGMASTAMYVAAFVERGFEIFQQQALEMGQRARGLEGDGERWEAEGGRGGRRHIGRERREQEPSPWERGGERPLGEGGLPGETPRA